jgi:Tfp pilus assembly protein PilO
MDQSAILILNRVKDNALNIVAIIIAVIIAFNAFKINEAGLVELKKKAQTEASKSQVLGEIGALENNFTKLKNKINGKSVDSIIHKVGNFAKESSVELINIRPMQEKKFGIYSRYPFDLQLSAASYHSIGKFISTLEKSPDLYFIETLNINQGAGNESKVAAKIVLSTILIEEKL